MERIHDRFLFMEENGISRISKLTGIKENQVRAVIKLLDEGATVPFIARYRKEMTGELDEVQITDIRDSLSTWVELEKRRAAILKSLKERELLSPELETSVNNAETLPILEDIYLPFRPKKRTRGIIAREAGLLPLAVWLLKNGTGADIDTPLKTGAGTRISSRKVDDKAAGFLNPEKKIESSGEALSGARDIIAEVFNETSGLRRDLRDLFQRRAVLSSRIIPARKKEASKYRDYFDWSEPAGRAPSHRILAILRGASEGFLTNHFLPPEEEVLDLLFRRILGRNRDDSGGAVEQIRRAGEDGYKRLTSPSLENEYRKLCKERADGEAIGVFAENLRELLLSPPLGSKRILALDPGLRTGCKLVCLDEKGDLKNHGVIYPLPPHNKVDESRETLRELCRKWDIQAVAVGNGTGGREAEDFARHALEGLTNTEQQTPTVVMVNESGASIYSASPIARLEFPDEDITVRGAVSIGRRLMDPLAELVKIDPKSIGVGQYQHDVDQKELKRSLDDVVLSCVNGVGVEVNTASSQLLKYVSGISAKTADAITSIREKEGGFAKRSDLKKVPGLGPKAYEQAAGFLRIRGGKNLLDGSAVHPERYPLVKKIASDLGTTPAKMMAEPAICKEIELEKYVSEDVGLPTLKDIIAELEKPGRDPRAAFEIFQFSPDIHIPEDLKPGMILPGIVTNVTAFGAFVDIGVHQDGLVHISQLSDSFVKDPSKIVHVNQKVEVKVLDVDLERKRIALSMKNLKG